MLHAGVTNMLFSKLSKMSKKFCFNLGSGSTNLGYQTPFNDEENSKDLTPKHFKIKS
jgi:hypothetical protein